MNRRCQRASLTIAALCLVAGAARAAAPAVAVNMAPFTGNDAHVAKFAYETLLTNLAKSSQFSLLDERAHPASANPPAYVLGGTCLVHENRIVINILVMDGATRRTIPGASDNIEGPRAQLLSMIGTLGERVKTRILRLSAVGKPAAAVKTVALSDAPKQIAQAPKSEPAHTSVIVDTRGFKVERSQSPCLRRKDGSSVWTGGEATPEFVIDEGIVVYARNEDDARANKRAGNNPLMIKAAGRFDDSFRCDPLLADEDADLLIQEAKRSGFLARFKVIFIID